MFAARVAVAAALAAGVAARSATAQLTSHDRAALGDLAPPFAQSFGLIRGWFRDTSISYYDFGPVPVTTSPLFILVTGFDAAGTPQVVGDQLPIVTSLPGLDGYSAVWQVHYLVVGPGYRANTLRAGRDAVAWTLAGRARMVIPGVLVTAAVVPAGSTLEGDPDARPLLEAWYKGSRVPFFDFGPSSLVPAPIFPFVTGFADGAPQFLRAQANVVDVVPTEGQDPRDLWDVHFVSAPPGYAPDSLRSLAGLSGLTLTRAASVRNCPVVIVDGRRAPRRALAAGGR